MQRSDVQRSTRPRRRAREQGRDETTGNVVSGDPLHGAGPRACGPLGGIAFESSRLRRSALVEAAATERTREIK